MSEIGLEKIYSGKVRDLYRIDDQRLGTHQNYLRRDVIGLSFLLRALVGRF